MEPARTFRTRPVLRIAVAVAAVFWAAILAYLLQFPEVTAKTFLSAFAFLAFFVLFSAYYDRLAVTVTPEGILFTGMWRRAAIPFEEIVKVEIWPGPAMTIYDVVTRRGPLHFSSWFAGHRELLGLLVEKARLASGR
jgi:hypothetical protein